MNDEVVAQERIDAAAHVAGDKWASNQNQAERTQIAPTIELDETQLCSIARRLPGGANNLQGIYPLSSLQEGMLFHHLLNRESDTYVLSTLFELRSQQDVAVLAGALQKVMARHDGLRAAVFWEELPRPLQVICQNVALPIERLVLQQDRDALEQLYEHMRPQRHRFDLQQAPLIRLLEAEDGRSARWYAVLQVHHLVCDHQSLASIVAEAMAFIAGREHELPAVTALRDHVEPALSDAEARRAETFFKDKLGDVDEPSAPFGMMHVHGDGGEIEEARLSLDVILAAKIREQAKRARVSAARMFHAAWALVVGQTSGRDDIVYGTVLLAARRRSTRAQHLVGMSVNTLPLRLNLQGVTVKELLQLTHEELSAILQHEQVPLTLAQRCSGLGGSAPLFTSLLNYRHNTLQPSSNLTDAAGLRVLVRGEAWTNYPITMIVDDVGDGFALTAQADRRIGAWRILGYLQTVMQSLLQALDRDPAMPALALTILPEDERARVVTLFNATQVEFSGEKLVHEMFEEQVARTPNQPAVVYEDQTLSYAELNARSNRLARYLISRGVRPDELVGIFAERSLELVVGLMGILKAGGAYVPLDPTYPHERLQYLLENAAPRVLLTQTRLLDRLPETSAQRIALDGQWDKIEPLDASNVHARALALNSRHLAYVIYTSGSTGQPKGAMNEHRALINRLMWMQKQYRLGCDDRVLQKTPFSFDVSVWEFFWTLMTGATLIVARPRGHHDPAYLRQLIEARSVTTLHFVPSMLQIFLDRVEPGWCPTLRRVICSGEELTAALQNRCLQALPNARLSNLYGPTEAAIDVTFWECEHDEHAIRVPIGRPIDNVQMYVLNRRHQPVPVGVVGELYIGGVGVGRGYLNREDLTRDRFLPDPFQADPDSRLYKTGDLGQWREDGAIEYLGRTDHQVKIRGLRIELGEIEIQLKRHPQVRDATVIAREDVPGEKRLVAYVVPRDESTQPASEELRAHVKRSLPDYMVPSAFVGLPALPLSPNGKLDRRALPAPSFAGDSSRAFEAPLSEVEEILAGIWQELLHVERIGRHDNFFQLGGHSLLIVQMMDRLRRLGLFADIRRVLETPRLSDLAAILGADHDLVEVPANLIPAGCAHIRPEMLPLVQLDAEHIQRIVEAVPGGTANIQDVYPLTPLQEGILFHHLLSSEAGDAYVVPTLLLVESRARVDQMIQALQAGIHRHDVLRTCVVWEQLPQAVQVVQRRAALSVDTVVLDAERDLTVQLKEWTSPARLRLDLRHAPLLRLRVAARPHTDQWYVQVLLHHMVADATSQQILISEMVAQLEGSVAELPEPVPYRNHVAQVFARRTSGGDEAFFTDKLGDVIEPTAPFGLVNVYGDGSDIEQADIALDPELAGRVRRLARVQGVSAATLFHAAAGLVIAHTSGRDDVVFGSVLLGRLRDDAGARRILGMFINTLPLRLQLQGLSATQLVQSTQRELIQLLAHEQASLATAQRCSGIGGSEPLFSALLNYRHSASRSEAQWSSASGIELLASYERTNYPVTLSVDDLGDGFTLAAKTDRRLDPLRVAQYFQTAVQALIEALEQSSRAPVLSLPLLPEQERIQLIESFNQTQASYPRDHSIQELFEAQVRRTPGEPAAILSGDALTFAELNARANQLARCLRDKGAGPDRVVGLCVERGLDMILGLIGILKAGGAYLPLDPDYPAERLQYMVEDAAPVLLLTQLALKDRLPHTTSEIVLLDDPRGELARYPAENLEVADAGVAANHLAYVIYTSGSTGKPKGVAIEHRNVLSLWQGLEHIYRQIPGVRRVAVNASFTFDASVKQFIQLLSGRTLVPVPQEVRWDAAKLLAFLRDHEVDAIDVTPGQLKTWIAAGLLEEGRSPSKLALVGGEPIDPQLWRALADCRHIEFFNVYGPTESTVDTTFARVTSDVTPHIGRPMENRRVYLLDAHGAPVSLGVAGEIYIGGAGIARGYLNRPELSAERFMRDRFSAEADARMYRTGDLGRWRADGTLEYLGRNDQQLKIRGHRIELGEIEARLALDPSVKDAVVLGLPDAMGEMRLVAYITSRGERQPDAEALRDSLRRSLPDYMVPSALLVLERLPLSVNGKLDRRALPVPEFGARSTQDYESPRGEVEEVLAGLWQSLLGLDRVGRRDNFFELGGHSLLVMQLMERLRRVGLSADVRDVFEHPTLAALATVLSTDAAEIEVPPNLIPAACERITPELLTLVTLEPKHIEHIANAVPGGAPNIEDVYPLAPLQEGILFHHLLNEQGGDTYVVPMVLSVASRERLDQLISALQAIIDRYDVLRTAVLWEQLPQPVQVVYRKAVLPVDQVKLDPRSDALAQVREWMGLGHQRLNLQRAPLLRLQVAQDPHNDTWYVLLQHHHVTSDHVTLEVVTEEVVSRLSGVTRVASEAIPYRNFVAQAMARARANDAETYFRGKLGDIDEPTAPFGILDVYGDGTQIEQDDRAIDPELARHIRVVGRRYSVSAATLFHAAWGLAVASMAGREDIVFGTVLLGRIGNAGAKRILGLFINTLPLRLHLRGSSVKQLVEQTQRELIGLMSYEQASLAAVQRCSRIDSSAPLFTALLNYRHSVPNATSSWSAADGVEMLAVRDWTNYPITVSVDDFGGGFAVKTQTDRRIDARRVTDYLYTALQSLVRALQESPQRAALQLPVLPEQEHRDVIERWNATRSEYPAHKLIHELFEEQVARTPNELAAVHEGRSLTYAALNGRANQLARFLKEQGVSTDQPVGICVQRGLDVVVGLLGILKAGAAYLPLDPNYPPERLHHMLLDAAPLVVLTQQELQGTLPATQSKVIALDLVRGPELSGYAADNLSTAELGGLRPSRLYVIYTSGSTGRPKGTVMGHRAMANLIEWHRRQLPLASGQRGLQFAALSFDVAFQETFSTLCDGGSLVMLDEWIRRDARALLEFLGSHGIERMFVPPLMLQALAEEFKRGTTELTRLRDVITAGEQLRITSEISAMFQRLPACRLHNHYGPTETHVVTALTLRADAAAWPALPSIGRPISNSSIYVLNSQGQPTPAGVAGEIYIGGAGLALGYLDRPELTAARFVPDPFSPSVDGRMYKTGDLGRWCVDGTIEYLGRNDDQVKIRGYRIEPGEIEAQLALHEYIKEAAVIAREDVPGEKRLVAYVTTSLPTLSVDELRLHLETRVPEYMVPSAFVVLESLPVTPSGKLSRRDLPAPDAAAYGTREFEPPHGELERAIADIWGEVLRVERVGRHDNFFKLGGHSLLATRVLSRLRDTFATELPIRALFEFPTIEQLARQIQVEGDHPGTREEDLRDEIAELADEMVLARIEELERELGYACQART